MKAAFLKKIANGSIMGLLETNVSTEEMLKSLDWEKSELDGFYKLQSEKKKKEWLGVRLLLKEIFENQSFDLNYNDQGKPFLTDLSYHISISHSGKYVCILTNQKLEVGVDIQVFKSNIEKGTELFMSEKELKDCTEKINSNILHVYWGAKESIYKLIGLKDTNIKTDIYISPFDFRNFGQIRGKYKNSKLIKLNYELSDEYVLVYTC